MALTINTNVNSLRAWRNASSTESALARSIERLSSGKRINSASDDAAGLGITDRMTASINGTSQAKRNIVDATSMLQVADDAMASVTDSLQRLRTLAVQAGNKTLSAADRDALTQESNQILEHISQIGAQTMFNGQTVFSQDLGSIGGNDKAKRAFMDSLRTGWLTSAEQMIKQYYGIEGDGAAFKVDLNTTDGPFNVLAFVTTTATDEILSPDMADFPATNPPDGGTNPTLYGDRIVAHEMVHAVMGRATGFFSGWFNEGAAELIHGGDERLAGAVAGLGASSVVNGVTTAGYSYEGAYAAARYLHDQLKEQGVEGGMKGLMEYLHNNRGTTLGDALAAVTGGYWATEQDFLDDFHANGVNFINTKVNFTNADTGAIGGLDADGGAIRNAKSVVSDFTDRSADDPLAGFTEVFPKLGGTTAIHKVQIQAGDDMGDTISLEMSAMNAAALGLDDLNLNRAAVALLHIDEAIDFVAKQRVVSGTSMKRLEIAADALSSAEINLTASRGRISDTDYASETASLTRSQILQQAASAMLTQANSMPNAVLSLLR